MGTRLENWDVLLNECIQDARDKPFEWGAHDCTTWAMTVRSAMTGSDPAPWLGTYKTLRGAVGAIKKTGHADLEEAATSVLGAPVAPLTAQRGDIVLMGDDAAFGGAFGVVIGSHAAFVAEDGLTLHPVSEARRAWRV